MSNVLLRSLLVSPAVLGLALASSATAQEADTLSQINQYANEGASLSQVRSVNQLSDVKPTDWAYQALRSLVERYGCIAGYPDGTFRGNRAMTRYEFAAGLNACLDTVNELIASATADLATQEDLLVLQRLQEEFQAELATLRGRVDALEARTAELEANQFSTTTKLKGEVIFSLQDEFGTPDFFNTPAVSVNTPGGLVEIIPAATDVPNNDYNTVFGGRVRLDLTSSFTGSDKLRIRLESENIDDDPTYPASILEYAGENASSNFNIDDLWYSFKPTDKSFVIVGVNGVASDNFAPTTAWEGGSFFSDYFDSPAFYEQDADEIGIGGNYQFNDNINLAAGFLSDSGLSGNVIGNNGDGDTPSEGVFVSNWAGMAQLTGTVGKFEGALAFIHEYQEEGKFSVYDGVGTPLTNFGNFIGSPPATNETLGVSMKYEFSPRFILSAFATHSWTDFKYSVNLYDPVVGLLPAGADISSGRSYSAGIGFVLPDLFREGNTGGVAVGIPPTVYDIDGVDLKDSDTPFAVDLFYDFKVSDNITITPGGIVLFNGAGGNSNTPGTDDTVFVGAIKTKFKF